MEKSKASAETIEHPDVAFEPRDVNARSLFMVGIGILVAGVVLHFGVAFLFDYFAARATHKGLQPSTAVPRSEVKQPSREPRLQVNPAGDLEEMRRVEGDKLNTYGWADREAGAVRIPVERAMTLLVQRGLPAVQPAGTAEAKQQSDQKAQAAGQPSSANSKEGQATGKE